MPSDEHRRRVKEALIGAKKEITLDDNLYPDSAIIVESESPIPAMKAIRAHVTDSSRVIALVVVEREGMDDDV